MLLFIHYNLHIIMTYTIVIIGFLHGIGTSYVMTYDTSHLRFVKRYGHVLSDIVCTTMCPIGSVADATR